MTISLNVGRTLPSAAVISIRQEQVGIMENKLAQIRREKKIGQSYLVDMLGVSRQTISSIENGRCTPSLELALDLADLLGLPLEELFVHENRFLQQS
jgi:putative transcriptional regulator